MVKNEKSLMAKKLCSMPNCTFEAETPEGILTVNITGTGDKSNPDEYDINKQIIITREDNTIFSTIKHRNWYSRSSNGGDYYIRELINNKADSTHPNGFTVECCHGQEHYNNISYKGVLDDFRVNADGICIGNKKFALRNGVLCNQLDDEFVIGFDVQTDQEIVYVKRVSGEMQESVTEINVNSGRNFVEMITRYNTSLETAIDQITKKLSVEYGDTVGEQLSKLLPSFRPVTTPDAIQFRIHEARTKGAMEIFKNDSQLLESYYSPETVSAIYEAAEAYTNKTEKEEIQNQIKQLRRKLEQKHKNQKTIIKKL